MAWLGHACGECRYCVDGRENLCEQQQNTGYSVDGGYAEYELADARFAVPVPDGVTPLDAAPLTCAGVTTYAAIKNAHVVPGERVAVFGIGGLGHLAVQYARLVGARSSPSTSPRRSSTRRELGADHVVDATRAIRGGDPDSVARIRIVLAVAPQVFDQAFAALNRGGRLVLVRCRPTGR